MKRRHFAQTLLMAMGAASIALLPLLVPLLSPNHLYLYHLTGSAEVIFLPTIVALFAVATLFALCFWVIPMTSRLVRDSLSILLLVLLPALLLSNIFSIQFWAHRSRYTWLLSTALLLTFILVRSTNAPLFKKICQHTQTLLLFLGIFGLLCLFQLLWGAWRGRTLNTSSTATPNLNPVTAKAPGRIIWILFDELSYQQTFEHRLPGLQLPNFDALHQQSIVFTHTQPAGYMTEMAVPSMMEGRKATDLRSTTTGWPYFRYGNSGWQRFNPQNTVFADAEHLGLQTAISGWFNPYCRILPSVLQHCYWTFPENPLEGMQPDQSLWHNILALLPRFHSDNQWPSAQPHEKQRTHSEMNARMLGYHQLLSASDAILQNEHLNFVLLHFSVPHPPGFYNRKTGAFPAGDGTYFDNLVLADQLLSHLRTVLTAQGEWDSATIVLMGDHSWRVPMWKVYSDWTPLEQRVTHGAFDDRPVYMVKLPNQQTSLIEDHPFSALRTRALFDRLMHAPLETPQQLASWATGQN